MGASEVLDLESWREQLCPRGSNHNRTEGSYCTKGRKTRGLGGKAAGSQEALRPFPQMHSYPRELQAPEDMVEYFNYVVNFKNRF